MITAEWRGRCDNGASCVEVRQYAGYVLLRAAVDPHAVTPIRPGEWAEFVAAVKRGDFDLDGTDG